MKTSHYQILIVGGGAAGITVAARLLKKNKKLQIGIIEPSEKHYYQPAWTLVGAGAYMFKKTERSEASVIPKGCDWIKNKCTDLAPEKNSLTLENGEKLTYDYLVMAPGIQFNIDDIPGLREGLEKGDVISTYTNPERAWEKIKNFRGGNAVFTQPATPIKCGGAPQKIMYLADDYFEQSGVKDKTTVLFATPGSVIFGVKPFADTLTEVVNRKNIMVKFFYKLVRIDNENKIVHFEVTSQDESKCTVINDQSHKINEVTIGGTTVGIPFDILHTPPPQSAPDFIRHSKLAHASGDSKGWIDVDINSLQHNVYPNVFALGDAAALPTAKTGAAVRKQAPVVANNLYALIENKKVRDYSYTGYSSCPLVTGYGKMVLAEFGYNNEIQSDPLISKLIDVKKENYSMWLLKKYGLPQLYWNGMLKGRA